MILREVAQLALDYSAVVQLLQSQEIKPKFFDSKNQGDYLKEEKFSYNNRFIFKIHALISEDLSVQSI